jgi:hypothetical protein
VRQNKIAHYQIFYWFLAVGAENERASWETGTSKSNQFGPKSNKLCCRSLIVHVLGPWYAGVVVFKDAPRLRIDLALKDALEAWNAVETAGEAFDPTAQRGVTHISESAE